MTATISMATQAIENKLPAENITQLLYEIATTNAHTIESLNVGHAFGRTLTMSGLEDVHNSSAAMYAQQKNKRPYAWNMWIPMNNYIIKGMIDAGVPQNAREAFIVLKQLRLAVDDLYFTKVEAQLVKIALRDLNEIGDIIDFAAELTTDRAFAIFCMAFGSYPTLLNERSLRRRKDAEREAEENHKRSAIL